MRGLRIDGLPITITYGLLSLYAYRSGFGPRRRCLRGVFFLQYRTGMRSSAQLAGRYG